MRPPQLLLIADRFVTDAEGVAQRAAAAVRAGAGWVQLRDHEADPDAFARHARHLVDRLRQISPDVLISVNTRVEVARELGAALHVGRRGPSVAEARAMMGDALLSAAVHTPEDAAAAAEAGADALIFAPVFPTPSKPGHPGAGLEVLAAACEAAAGVPVLALGGLRPERVGEVLSAGAHGVGMVSIVLDVSAAVVPVIVCAFNFALEQWEDELHQADRPDHRGQ